MIALLGAWLIAAVVVTLRHQGDGLLDSMWAEDGTVYVQQALERGALEVLFEPYAGYLHVPARSLAILATALPIDLAATIMTGGAVLTVAALAVFVFVATDGVIASPILRFIVAASMVLTPVARVESLDSMANLHFSFLVAAFWALLSKAESRTLAVACCLVVGAAALSDPLAVLLVPVGVYRWLHATSRWQRAATVVGGACLAVQLSAISGGLASIGERSPDPLAIAEAYPLKVVGGLLFGLRGSIQLWSAIGPALAIVGAVALGLVVVALATSHRDERRTGSALALGTSLAIFAVAMWLRWNPSLFPGNGDQFLLTGVRYLLAPVLLLLGAIVLLVDGAGERIHALPAALPTAILVLAVGATSILDLVGADGRTNAPTWVAEVAGARTRCAGGATRVEVPIAPVGWQMTMDCQVLAR